MNLDSDSRSKKRWTQLDLVNALRAIDNNEMSLREAARLYGISTTTLSRNLQSSPYGWSYRHPAIKEPLNYSIAVLSMEDDATLADGLCKLIKAGVSIQPAEVKTICYALCVEKSIVPCDFNHLFRTASDAWYQGFIQRHPEAAMPVDVMQATQEDGQEGNEKEEDKGASKSSKERVKVQNNNEETLQEQDIKDEEKKDGLNKKNGHDKEDVNDEKTKKRRKKKVSTGEKKIQIIDIDS